ncbi:efflux RND transporter periplasmic adaptor subunit [Patescibacteria group bacterium]|nr:efflux RND transporter periplasmic adaptor subunit [Patescibacteria group bacterium]MBU1448625.1 efflux RND transporter periplasmic adaptor subunit [Patescibacteria group bacterium]MBU2613416.1 efflux RND transporter periplasmic adaptor subunit [Patescibacteria group bacterium]
MAIPAFLKKKRTYIVLAAVILLVAWYAYAKSKSGQVTYETAAVERRDLVQTVEVTGEIKPAARIDLAFKQSGTISDVNVKVGDKVMKGDVLAELKDDDVVFALRSANAALAVAAANLNARLAGETDQAIRVAETQVDQAQAGYDKAVADLASTKLTTQNAIDVAELNVQTAKNSLANQDAVVSQAVQNSYDSARATLSSALGPLQVGLTDGDKIVGVDDTASNQMYKNVLGFLDYGSMETARNSYVVAKAAKQAADTAVNALSSASTKDQILAAADTVLDAISKVQTFLSDVQRVLSASMTSQYLTATELAAKKATIDADRTTISAQNTTVLTAVQTTKNTELTKTQTIDQLQDAYTSALTALDTARTNAATQVTAAESAVAVQAAGLEASKATLDLRRSGPRAVDVAGLRAAVEQAQVNADKAANDLKNIQIVAPVDGTVSEVIPDVGELVQTGITIVRMVGTSSYDIEALVPETDIAKVEVGQSASITLDAYGDDVTFTGTVTAEDPDQTKVQEAIYYKIRVQIDREDRDVKPGMTANVTVTTGEGKGTLVMPLRAIRTTNGTKTVRVLKDGEPSPRDVIIGLRGDEGRVEVTSGLEEGELVIVGETTK